MKTRRSFIKKSTVGTAGILIGGMGMSAKSYGRIIGSNNKVKVGVLGFSSRFKGSLSKSYLKFEKDLNFEISSVCDLWHQRRAEGKAFLEERAGYKIKEARNSDELWHQKPDAVIISTADFQHALLLAEAVNAGCDVYCEKPFAESMDDANLGLDAAKKTKKVIQIGSQRRSGANYHAAHDYIQSGKFGKITMVEMTWNVNQPARWRQYYWASVLKESDTDWKRFLMNRPYEPWNPRKYMEYRLFWPYSSGIPGQWMAHQIDTVHWFSHLPYPRSVAANGGIYMWQDGRENADTLTAVFDYGPLNNPKEGFQVVYSSRFHNSDGGTKEVYFSNGGKLDLSKSRVTPDGGLIEKHAKNGHMEPFLLEDFELPKATIQTSADAADNTTDFHMLNWMQCVRNNDVKTNAPVEAGYSHSIANIMVTASLRTGLRAVFDEKSRQVLAGGKVFKY